MYVCVCVLDPRSSSGTINRSVEGKAVLFKLGKTELCVRERELNCMLRYDNRPSSF